MQKIKTYQKVLDIFFKVIFAIKYIKNILVLLSKTKKATSPDVALINI